MHLLMAHPVMSLIVAFGVMNAVAGALPKPQPPQTGLRYEFVYRFMHGIAGNLQYALSAKFPQYVPPATPQQ